MKYIPETFDEYLQRTTNMAGSRPFEADDFGYDESADYDLASALPGRISVKLTLDKRP